MKKQGFWYRTKHWLSLGLIAMAIALTPLLLSIRSHRAEAFQASTSPISAYQPLDFQASNSKGAVDQTSVPKSLQASPFETVFPSAVKNDFYKPVEEVEAADPSNYGYRYLTDIDGNPADNPMIVVLHETVGSASSAVNTIQTYHPNDNNQVSYHSIIRRNGNIIHLVHPQMRAFGAGNSVFEGSNGSETVRTNPDFPGSVNNFAYHTSLETPSDGRGNQRYHSGYTDAQYRSLAWLVAHLPVPDERITTHKAVDRSNSRMDPRSFNGETFIKLLHEYDRSAVLVQ